VKPEGSEGRACKRRAHSGALRIPAALATECVFLSTPLFLLFVTAPPFR